MGKKAELRRQIEELEDEVSELRERLGYGVGHDDRLRQAYSTLEQQHEGLKRAIAQIFGVRVEIKGTEVIVHHPPRGGTFPDEPYTLEGQLERMRERASRDA